MFLLGERDRLRFAGTEELVQLPPHTRVRDVLHDDPPRGERAGKHLRPGTIGVDGKLGVHGRRDDDPPVEASQQIDAPDTRQGDQRTRVRDDHAGHEAARNSSSSSSGG